MNSKQINEIISKAEKINSETQKEKKKKYYQHTLSWFVFLGILKNKKMIGKTARKVSLSDALKAGELEPRILEVLPGLLYHLPLALEFNEEDIPDDLRQVMQAINKHSLLPNFRNVPSNKYMRWVNDRVFEQAKAKFYSVA